MKELIIFDGILKDKNVSILKGIDVICTWHQWTSQFETKRYFYLKFLITWPIIQAGSQRINHESSS